MNFYFFDPGTLDPEAGRRGPGCQNLAFQRFDPMILCSFLWRIRWTTLESHSSKQMMVYEQITFFIKNLIFYNFFWDRKTEFWIKKNRNRNRIEPEPDRTGTGLNRSRPKPNRTEPNRGIPGNADLKKNFKICNLRSETSGREGFFIRRPLQES